jgi:hypothetical protein
MSKSILKVIARSPRALGKSAFEARCEACGFSLPVDLWYLPPGSWTECPICRQARRVRYAIAGIAFSLACWGASLLLG